MLPLQFFLLLFVLVLVLLLMLLLVLLLLLHHLSRKCPLASDTIGAVQCKLYLFQCAVCSVQYVV